jgi:hypothetical protein
MTTEPRLPEVGEFVRGVGTLREVVIVPPPPQPPPTTVYVFEDVTAQMRILIGGEVVDTGATRDDFHGKDTCVNSAVEAAKDYIRQMRIGPKSDVEVVVVRTVSLTSRERHWRNEPNFYDKTFVAFSNEASKAYTDRTEDVDEVVWSSRNPRRKA